MIKINLVAEGRKPVIKRQARTRGIGLGLLGDQAALYSLLAVAAIGAAAFGGWYWTQRAVVNENKDRIRLAQKKVDELRDIITQVEEFEQKEAELEQKISVITDLKNSQRGPVDIMDHISQALPELLWIDRLDQQGDKISLSGRAFNQSAIEHFIQSLDESPIFAEPVLNDITQRNEVKVFSLVLTKVSPRSTEEELAEAAGS